jgi:hypothetical protein
VEEKLAQFDHFNKMIKLKCEKYSDPRNEITFDKTLYSAIKKSNCSLDNDRLLLCGLNVVGYGNWKDLFEYFKKDSRAFLDFNLLYLCYLYQSIRTLSTEILNTHVSKLV